jgi:Fe2+ or Zn2+ uptake regulation protein
MPRTSRIAAALNALLARGERHAWTLEDMQAALARDGMLADFSSVFRSAKRLADAGVLRRVMLPDGSTRFELDASHHDHLQCTRCDALVPIPCMVRPEMLDRLQALTGFAIADHSVTLTGLCQACQGMIAGGATGA